MWYLRCIVNQLSVEFAFRTGYSLGQSGDPCNVAHELPSCLDMGYWMALICETPSNNPDNALARLRSDHNSHIHHLLEVLWLPSAPQSAVTRVQHWSQYVIIFWWRKIESLSVGFSVFLSLLPFLIVTDVPRFKPDIGQMIFLHKSIALMNLAVST
jgi:hypothetical protein